MMSPTGPTGPSSVRRLLMYSGAAGLVLALVIIALTIRDAQQVTRLSDAVRLHYRPLAEAAYELEIGVFELGAAAVNYLAQNDAAHRRVVLASRAAMDNALKQYERYAAISPRVMTAETGARLRRYASTYLALADTLVDLAGRAPRQRPRSAAETRTMASFSDVQRQLDDVLDRDIQPRAIASWHGTADLARVGARRTAWGISILAPLALLIAAYAIFTTSQAYARTRRLHEEAQRISQQKTEFASITAHELRSPLTGMLGSLRLMKSGRAGVLPETALPYVDMASRNAARLLTLINELLELDRIEAGMMPFNDEDVAAVDIVRLATDALSGMAAELTVRIDVQPHTPARVR
ncbi:MAG TPA: histidine kinase dimerization/phospho-acceptor domain-containing protein, partial [Gemmatimonadaceae bacterium]|nr:histidine kinase dimerization/phospho-acceptor domain-containing protein [Gemmatimonadaceae bacterium]